MNSATLFVVLWLASGGQQTVLKLENPNKAMCLESAATVRYNIWLRHKAPVGAHYEVYCGLPNPALTIAH